MIKVSRQAEPKSKGTMSMWIFSFSLHLLILFIATCIYALSPPHIYAYSLMSAPISTKLHCRAIYLSSRFKVNSVVHFNTFHWHVALSLSLSHKNCVLSDCDWLPFSLTHSRSTMSPCVLNIGSRYYWHSIIGRLLWQYICAYMPEKYSTIADCQSMS